MANWKLIMGSPLSSDVMNITRKTIKIDLFLGRKNMDCRPNPSFEGRHSKKDHHRFVLRQRVSHLKDFKISITHFGSNRWHLMIYSKLGHFFKNEIPEIIGVF